MSMYKEAKERIPNQKVRIIEALRLAGESGLTNKQLSKIAMRYTARMAELYKMGYNIKLDNLGSGVVKYTLLSEPVKPVKQENALQKIESMIRQMGGEVTMSQLKEMLTYNNIIVAHKGAVQYK